jgi:hypothetical protein
MPHPLLRFLPTVLWTCAGLAVSGALLLHLLPHQQILQTAADDFLLALEAGYRVLDGQLPSRDWPSPVGPLFALVNAVPLYFGVDPDFSHRWADALLFVFLLPCLILAGRGLPTGVVPAAAVAATSFLFGQYEILSQDGMFYTVSYNRWTNAFLIVPTLWLAAAGAGVRMRPAADVAVGIALAVLAFTKANAALAGALIVAGSVVTRNRPSLRRWLAIVAPSMLVFLALLPTGIMLPHLRDLVDAAAGSNDRLPFIWRQTFSGLFLTAFASLCILLVQRRRLQDRTLPWLAAWTIASLFLGNIQNHTAIIPAISVAALAFGAILWPPDEPGRKTVLPLLLTGAIGSAVLSFEGMVSIRPTVSRTGAVAIDSPLLPHTAILVPQTRASDSMRDRILAWHAADNLARWQDALRLVRPGETVMTVGQVNVARIAGAHSPRGAFLWQDPRRNWTPADDAVPERRLQGACAVLVRRTPRLDLPEDAILVQHWRNWLAAHARLAAQGDVYDRFDLPNPACAPSGAALDKAVAVPMQRNRTD